MSHIKDDVGESWREALLQGVSCLPEIACIPSTLVVLGDDARPILSNPQQKNVWVAVGEIGRGRVAVVGHEGYISKINTISGHENPDIKRLNDNLTLWLTKNDHVDVSEISNLQNITEQSLSKTKIVLCTGKKASHLSDTHILEFLNNGGSLLHAMCAWGWLQRNRSATLHDLPLFSILEEVGIVYTNGYFRVPKHGLKISHCTASESNHITHALNHTHLDSCCHTLSQINDVPLRTLHEVMRKSGHKIHSIIAEKGHECVPSGNNPVSSTVGKSVMFLHDVLTKTGNGHTKMVGIDHFPGDFDIDPPIMTGKVIIESSIAACHPTGLYVRAGEEIRIDILSPASVKENWAIQIGCHTDHLKTTTAMKRWPIITERMPITTSKVTMKSPYGGLLYVYSPKMKAALTIHVHNVIEAPHFDLSKPETVTNWKNNRRAPGLWADICGHHIMFSLPAKSIRDIDDPTPALQTWDRVVRAHYHLRGLDPNAYYREWIVSDIQPCGGYMHSGYPIVTHLDIADPSSSVFLFKNEVLLSSGNWGLFHELGHNMQMPAWTFKGTGEVTCNIFTLHAMDVISQKPTWIHPWLNCHVAKAQKYIKESSDFCKWQADPGIALFVYAQIIHHFGWSVYKKAFRHYENHGKTSHLKTDEDKIDFWFHTMSKFAEYDLSPLADLWNIPLCSSCREKCAEFTPFLPDDEITRAVPQKLELLKKKYPRVVRTIRKPFDYFEDLPSCSRKWSVLVNKLSL